MGRTILERERVLCTYQLRRKSEVCKHQCWAPNNWLHELGVCQDQNSEKIVGKEQIILLESRIKCPDRPLGLSKGQGSHWRMRSCRREMSSGVDPKCRNKPRRKEEDRFDIHSKNPKLRVQGLFHSSTGSRSGSAKSTRELWGTLQKDGRDRRKPVTGRLYTLYLSSKEKGTLLLFLP